MNRPIVLCLTLALATGAVNAAGGLDDFLRNVNAQARIDMDGFSAQVSTQFGVPDVKVRAVLGKVGDAGSAFLVFQLGEWTGLPPERIVRVYQDHKGKGWGVVAQELGIKPGSAEFHRLKRGDLQYGGSAKGGKDKDKGKKDKPSKGKGKNKD